MESQSKFDFQKIFPIVSPKILEEQGLLVCFQYVYTRLV